MLQIRMKLIRKVSTPHALASFAGTGGVTSLQHEASHIAVEDSSIVVARCGEG